MEKLFINKDVMNNTLLLFFNNLNECMNLVSDVDSLKAHNNYIHILNRYYIDSTKIFRYMNELISKKDLIKIYADNKDSHEDIDEFFDIINLFNDEKLILILSEEDLTYYPFDSYKYLITPLGILFYVMSNELYNTGSEEIHFYNVLKETKYIMGQSFNDLIFDRIQYNLKKVGGALNGKEAVYVLYLLFIESLSKTNSLNLKRPVGKDLSIPLNVISKYVFNEPLFQSDEMDDWIRRTTASLGLRAKLFNKYSKEEEDNYYKVYLEIKQDEVDEFISKIIGDIANIKNVSDIEIYKIIVKFIDEYVNNQTILYENNLYIPYKLISHKITTIYLLRMLNIMKGRI